MRTIKCICTLLAFLALQLSTRAQTHQFSDNKDSLERLVYRGSAAQPDYNPHPTAVDKHDKFEHALSQFSNVNERLLNLVDHDFKVSANLEALGLSLFALSCRRDLTHAQLERICTEIARFADDSDELSDLNKQMISGSLAVLANYPAPQHEELAIKFTKSSDIVLAVNAVKVLGKIGSKRSVGVVSDVIQKRKKTFNGTDDHIGSLLDASFKMLTQRLSHGTNGYISNLQPALVKATNKTSTLLFESSASALRCMVVILIVGAAGLLWLLVKKRK